MSYEKPTVIEPDSKPFKYYRTEVLRHWDPSAIDLEEDRQNLLDSDVMSFPEALDGLRDPLARFGAGEQSVTEDLAPLATVLDDINDQIFITTQLYEEAKHSEFFHRYWTEVINPVEEELGVPTSSPYEDRWFGSDYKELFDRNEDALYRLLEDDSPEAQMEAYCHYHMSIEGMLAESGYYGLQSLVGRDQVVDALPVLPGLDTGLQYIRGDEGRHVGFGALKLNQLVESGEVSYDTVEDTLDELLEVVHGALLNEDAREDDDLGMGSGAGMGLDDIIDLTGYAETQRDDRLEQIRDIDVELDVDDPRPAISD